MFFFFSSRRRHTRFDCDWSSDVCSSDLAVARALVHDPSLVLADEPSGNLDHANADRLHELFFRLAREYETAVRSEEHTSELQSQSNLGCRLLLEKKKQQATFPRPPRQCA